MHVPSAHRTWSADEHDPSSVTHSERLATHAGKQLPNKPVNSVLAKAVQRTGGSIVAGGECASGELTELEATA